MAETVNETGHSLVITQKGEPTARAVSPSRARKNQGWLGRFSNTGSITGDIVSPAVFSREWERVDDGAVP